MKWHIAHRHEIPAAFDTLGKDFEAKTASLQEENTRLKQKLSELETKLEVTTLKLSAETAAKLEAEVQVLQLTKERDTVIWAMVVRDQILKEKLGICLKLPFETDKGS
jgi:hypothetical protein